MVVFVEDDCVEMLIEIVHMRIRRIERVQSTIARVMESNHTA